MNEIRLIIDSPLPGAQNMAIDEALLLDAAENNTATLRFYGWCEPTLSLGYFQRYDDRFSHAASRDCAIVRRQTGGGAILHDRELTYSVTLPASLAIARQSEQLYTAVHEAFMAELQPRLPAGPSHWQLLRNDQPSARTASQEPFLCFQRWARGDVLLRQSASDGSSRTAKILGSAQRRYRGAILQHGSLLLEKSPHAPELAGWCDITDNDTLSLELINGLTVRLTEAFNAPNSVAETLPRELQSKAEQLANSKYGSAAWTKRR